MRAPARALMITLSIVSHGQAALVAALLDDIARVASPHVAAIVVTHNIGEPAPSWPESLASRIATISNAAPRGFGANHNAAFKHCTTPYFAVMNPDLRLMDDPFAALIARFESSTPAAAGVGAAAPHIVAADGTPEDAARRLITPIELIRRRIVGADRAPAKNPHWLAGMFLLLSTAAFRAVGGFDERYFLYCEDFDLCARLRLNGWRFEIVERATVVHAAQRASHRSLRHLTWHVSSLLKMWCSSAFWRYRRLLLTERK